MTVITKETVQGKIGITKSKKKEVLQTLNTKGNDCLFRINYQYLNHYWNIRTKTQIRSNARSAELRFEEHHEERVGTNKL